MKKADAPKQNPGKSEDTKTVVSDDVEMDEAIRAVFDAIDALPPLYIRKLKVLRVAIQAFNLYRAKIVQEFNYRKNHNGLPYSANLLQQAQIKYDEKTTPLNIPDELKVGADVDNLDKED